MAKPYAFEQQLWEVLEQTRPADFLRSEQGLDTPSLERASNLRGGERQRLGLARAFLHNVPLLLLDESTSNLDSRRLLEIPP